MLPFEFGWLQLYDAEVKKSILHMQLWIDGTIHTFLRGVFKGKILHCLVSTISVQGLRRQVSIVEHGWALNIHVSWLCLGQARQRVTCALGSAASDKGRQLGKKTSVAARQMLILAWGSESCPSKPLQSVYRRPENILSPRKYPSDSWWLLKGLESIK